MCFAGAVKYRFRLGCPVRLPDFFYVQHGEHHAFGIAQRHFAAARCQLLGKFLRHVERDRHWPENSAGQAHIVTNAFVIGFGHKAAAAERSLRS